MIVKIRDTYIKKGGLLAITVPHMESYIVPGHKHIYNAGILMKLLLDNNIDLSNAMIKTYGYNLSVIVPDFQIIPMMNPDGVIVGNSRTGFAGCDLNRRWTKPNEIIHPEIYSVKNLILNTNL